MQPRREQLADAIVAVLFVVMLIGTWQRWVHPIVDHGREMNLPVRLLAGDRLYVDVTYYYGPFAPYLNALLFRAFGVQLAVLHSAGIACALLILLIIRWLARRLLAPIEAALATALVLVTCAFGAYYGNYVQPYAYAALYGWLFALASLASLVHYLECRRLRWMMWSGVCIGLTGLCKPELTLLGIAPTVVGWATLSLAERRWLWRPALAAGVPAATIGGLVYGYLVLTVPWRDLVADTYAAFSGPQLTYFAQGLDGTAHWPDTGWAIVAAIGMMLSACAVTGLAGLALAPTVESLWRRAAWPVWAGLGAGAALWMLRSHVHQETIDINPLRAAPLVLSLTVAAVLWRFWRNGREFVFREQLLLLLAIFSLVAIQRVLFNISLLTPYTPFSIPTLIVIYLYVFFHVAPDLLLVSPSARQYAVRCATVMTVFIVVFLTIGHLTMARGRTHEIARPRGRVLVSPILGKPLEDALRFVEAHGRSGDYLLSLPQATFLNFMTDRANPLREEILVPGLLTPDREAAAIQLLDTREIDVVVLCNWPTPEYRDRAFGVDYNRQLMRWVAEHYHPVATFSESGRPLTFGDAEFFIRAYERNP